MDNAAKPHGKDLRKGRISLPNHAYLVTIVTAFRNPVFFFFRLRTCGSALPP